MSKDPDPLAAPRSRRIGPYAVAVVVLMLVVGAWLWHAFPPPPRVVLMATGPEGGGYDLAGRRYREILARHGVELRLVPTAGSAQNLSLLRDPGARVSIAMVQGGLAKPADAARIVSLGTTFNEPVWLFVRRGLALESPDTLRDLTVAIGAEGSGTRELALELLRTMGLDTARMRISGLPEDEAAEALLRGDLDFMAMVGSWDAKVIRTLLASDRATLVPFARADAHIALRPFLGRLVVPRGVGNMALDLPPNDVTLVGTKASLLVRRDLHPAIQYLLLEAASEVHSHAALFQAAGHFPAAEPSEVPLSAEARNYYRSGPPFLQRYLPFWLAVLIGRALIVVIPIVGVAYPLLRLLPALYGWSIRRRIFRLYGELKFLEVALEAREPGADMSDLIARLDEFERRVLRMRMPVTFTHLLYTLRIHAQMVRNKLERVPARRL